MIVEIDHVPHNAEKMNIVLTEKAALTVAESLSVDRKYFHVQMGLVVGGGAELSEAGFIRDLDFKAGCKVARKVWVLIELDVQASDL